MAIKVADTFIAVGGDLTSYRKSLGTAKTEAQSLGQQIKTALTNPAGFGGTSKVGSLIADLKLGRSLTASLKDATTGLGSTLKGLSVNALHTGLNGVKGVLGGLKGLASDVFKGFSIGLGIGSFQALGRAISDLVNVIPDLISKGRDYSRTVDDIADATGATTEDASKFTSTLLFLGQTTGGVINMLGQMSRNLEEQGPTLQRLGVDIKDSNGALLNQLQILDNARSAMVKWGLGTTQADQIAREFGRGGLRTLVDYLHLTDEQFAAVTEDARKSGLILTDAQRDLGESMIREEARFQNTLTGLGETIFTVIGPQIRAFFSQLTEFIQEHVTEISNAISKAISFVLGLAGALVGASDSLDSFSGAIQAANTVQSPYASHITDLRVELAKLDEQTDKVTDTTGDQRKAIQAQITVIDKQINTLKELEKQQDKTYKKALDLLYAELDAQGKLLDMEDEAAAKADRDLALTRALRQAKIDLFEAQAQLRKDAMEGKSTDQDALNIAKAQQGVLDAQKAIRDEAASRAHDDRRAELASVKEYIESVAKLLEEADNKKAALNTIRKREAVLSAREQAQLAAGDTLGAADTHLKVEGLKTIATKAEQEARNGIAQTALEKQKAGLQQELANVKSTVEATTAARKKEIAKQIKDLEAQEQAWKNIALKEAEHMGFITTAVSGPEGLTQALDKAREAGKNFGADLKTALGGVVDVFANVLTLLGKIGGIIGEIVDKLHTIQQVRDALADAAAKAAKALPQGPFDLLDSARGGKLPPGFLPGTTKPPSVPPPAGGDRNRSVGGPVDEGWWYLHNREWVLPPGLAEAFSRFSVPNMPALAGAGAVGAVSPHSHDVYMNGQLVSTLIDKELGHRSRRR